ncbi:MAG: hypothetical protein [Bacteriophage sp.]|nr:MAG: hypothetical protein [Bacteriophage sp.]
MSADRFKLKRGTTAQVAAYLPQQGEPVYDTTLKQLRIGDGVTMGGVLPSSALTADKLTTPRNIALSGSVTGSAAFDGSSNVSITTSVGTSLQSSLDAKAPLASPDFSGTPTSTTAVTDSSSTQIATTAFVVGQAASVAPVVDGTATVGTSLRYARQDHVHPTDTSRAPVASPSLTGIPLAPTPAVGTSTTQIATSGMLQAEIANKRAWTSYTPTVTATTGTYTSASATGRYLVFFGICYIEITITITTKNTGVNPIITLPVAALAGSDFMPIPAVEAALNGKLGVCQILAGLTTASCKDYNNADLVTGNGSIIKVRGFYPVA